MHWFALITERVAQMCAALGALVFFTSGLVYLYLARWTVTKADYRRIYDFCLNHTWLESALHKHFEHSLFFPKTPAIALGACGHTFRRAKGYGRLVVDAPFAAAFTFGRQMLYDRAEELRNKLHSLRYSSSSSSATF